MTQQTHTRDIASQSGVASKSSLLDDPLLVVEGLRVTIPTLDGDVHALERIDLVIPRGKTVCVVGESGSGKSMTARSILRLVPHPGVINVGKIRYYRDAEEMIDITALQQHGKKMRSLRGSEMSMIFQEPMSALSPVHTIGDQIIEMIRLHEKVTKKQATARGIELLGHVGIPNPEQRMKAYTFQLSGGMRQRAMIAMALACNPQLLIADEPTTALDVTTQAQILDLLRGLRAEFGMSMLFITHDLGVVAEMADDVVVMYLGSIVERATRQDLFTNPKHPYTQALLLSSPDLAIEGTSKLSTIRGMVPGPFERPSGCAFHDRCDHFMVGLCDKKEPPVHTTVEGTDVRCWLYEPEAADRARGPQTDLASEAKMVDLPTASQADAPDSDGPLISVRNLTMNFPLKHGLLSREKGFVRALNDVSFDIFRGETLGVVGESGCGKTTLGRCLIGTQAPTAGSIKYLGSDAPFEVAQKNDRALRKYRQAVRMVFQDPFSSLDPRMTVGDIIAEPLQNHGTPKNEIRHRVMELLSMVGLNPDFIQRYPHAFSGGQRQRIGIARALALSPELIIADEAVSALDVSVQAQILNLMKELQAREDLTFLFIAHNLSVVRHFCDRVLVMYLGRVVELATAAEAFATPAHPYTEALLSAAPVARVTDRRERIVLGGEIPDPAHPPAGCAFHTRCNYSDGNRCAKETPALRKASNGRMVACHYAETLTLMGVDGERRGASPGPFENFG